MKKEEEEEEEEKTPFSYPFVRQANATQFLPNTDNSKTNKILLPLIPLSKTLIFFIINMLLSPSLCILVPLPPPPPPNPTTSRLPARLMGSTGFLRLPKSSLVPPSSPALSAVKPSTDTTTCRLFPLFFFFFFSFFFRHIFLKSFSLICYIDIFFWFFCFL